MEDWTLLTLTLWVLFVKKSSILPTKERSKVKWDMSFSAVKDADSTDELAASCCRGFVFCYSVSLISTNTDNACTKH